MRNFREYSIWQDGITLSVSINKLTKQFPVEERFALADQLRRSASSIPSNIAEGAGRESESDFAHFLDIAVGSAFEAETQLIIAQRSGYISEEDCDKYVAYLNSIERRIHSMIDTIRKRAKANSQS